MPANRRQDACAPLPQKHFRKIQIGFIRNLKISRAAFYRGNLDAELLNQKTFVGHFVSRRFEFRQTLVSAFQNRETKTLWRQSASQICAWDGRFEAVFSDLFDRIG